MLQSRAASLLGLQLWLKATPFAASSARLARGFSSEAASNTIKVENVTDAHKLGASIADAARSKGQLTLSAAGKANIMETLKAIAAARTLLAGENLDVYFQPALGEDASKAFLVLDLKSTKPQDRPQTEEMHVSRRSMQNRLADKLAKSIREGATTISLRALGSGAAVNAAMATCLTRGLLKGDNLDLQLQTELFTEKMEDGAELPLVKVHGRVVPAV